MRYLLLILSAFVLLLGTAEGATWTATGTDSLKDCYLQSARSTNNNGGMASWRWGNTTTPAQGVQRPWLWFMLPDTNGLYRITEPSATLTLRPGSVIDLTTTGDSMFLVPCSRNVVAYEGTSTSATSTATDDSSRMTWGHYRYSAYAWTTAGGDMVADTVGKRIVDSTVAYAVDSAMTIDIDSSYIGSLLRGEVDNFGLFLLCMSPATGLTEAIFRSSEYATNTAYRWRLEFDYEVAATAIPGRRRIEELRRQQSYLYKNKFDYFCRPEGNP